MAEFTKTSSINVRLNLSDLLTVSVSPTGYNPSMDLNLRENQTVSISVEGEGQNATSEFEKLVNCIITAAVKADWQERYRNGYAYANMEPTVTVEKIRAWMERDEQESVDSVVKLLDSE